MSEVDVKSATATAAGAAKAGGGGGRLTKSVSQLAKVQAKLDAHCAEGKFYEAQQLYRSIYSRLAAQRKYDEAAQCAETGAHQMFKFNQGNSGGDLALLVLDSFTKADAKINSERTGIIVSLFTAFPKGAETAKQSFMKQAIVYSEKLGSNPFGSPDLHYAAAQYYASAGELSDATRHFVRADHPTEHAAMLVAWSKRGLKSERDLFIARAVLQYLCIENLAAANAVIKHYLSAWNATDPIDTPIIHFINFLLKTCEREAAPLFQMLRSKYAPSLARDSSFELYLNKIGELYFDIKAPQSMMNMITGLL